MACVLVHIEAEGDQPTPAALAALGEGRRIASALGATLYAASLVATPSQNARDRDRDRRGRIRQVTVPAESLLRLDAAGRSRSRETLTRELGQGGADKVVLITAESAGEPPLWVTVGPALAAACEFLRPMLVVFPATSAGADIAPRLAARLGAAFVADAAVEAGSRGEVVFTRAVYGGAFLRRIALDDLDRMTVVTLPRTRPPGRGVDEAEVLMLDVGAVRDPRVVYLGEVRDEARELDSARVVVTGGGGVSAEAWPMIGALARALGGEVGATRTACARGLAPVSRQIGLGGRRVAPVIYFSVGASGSPAHLAGVSPDAEIIAIDRDPDAPIFRVASYGVVGDVEEVLPALIAAIRKSGGAEGGGV